ncbi:MAG: hypothetical protein D6780_00290, partial [Candidatus Dadabacteria bacterium]
MKAKPKAVASVVTEQAQSFDHKQKGQFLADSFDWFLKHNRKNIFFQYNLNTKRAEVIFGDVEKILGVSRYEVIGNGALFLKHSHPADRFILLAALEKIWKKDSHWGNFCYRWLMPSSNNIKWLSCSYMLSKFKDDAHYMYGIITDARSVFTYIQNNAQENTSLALLKGFDSPYFVIDRDGYILSLTFSDKKHSWCNFGDLQFKQELLAVGNNFFKCFEDSKIEAKIKEEIDVACRKNKISKLTLGRGVNKQSLSLKPTLLASGKVVIVIEVVSLQVFQQLENKLISAKRAAQSYKLKASLFNEVANALQTLTIAFKTKLEKKKKQEIILESIKRVKEILQALESQRSKGKRYCNFK